MKYNIKEGTTSYFDQEGNEIEIANFTANIKTEFRYIDGKKIERSYRMTGRKGEDVLQETVIGADEFPGMKWISHAWGSGVVILPKPNSKELLKTIIQLSSDPEITDIYTHTGWIKIGKKYFFISNNSIIGEKTKSTNVNIEIPPDLRCISLPTEDGDVKDGIKASLMLRSLLPKEIFWMLIGATYRAPLGQADFTIHITGRTGTFKSEIAAIMQSHFGECTARELPASWASTANALEALAYKSKDSILTIDDFIPMGTSWQVKAYQKTADQLIRGQGNQSGRARLTDTSKLQETMYPRGIILSTGEDTPEGHSVRGRMMIAEFTPGEIDLTELTKAQKNKRLYAVGMTAYLQWLAGDLQRHRREQKDLAESIRDANIGIGHTRTPQMMGQLLSGIFKMLEFSSTIGMTQATQNSLFSEATEQLKNLANRQNEYLTAADPSDQFVSILRSILAANAGHLKGMKGGIPHKGSLLGWTTVGDPDDLEMKSHGPRLGWADHLNNIAYLDAAVVYDTIRRHSRGSITITRQTLYKRLRESGHLQKIDETRQRNTVRVQCEQAGRSCLALKLNLITEGEDGNA